MAKQTENTNKIAYGIGNLGYSTTCQTMSNFIMFFATSVAGINGTLVGIAISLATFYDAITDPLVGFYSDKCAQTNPNSRQNFILISSLLLALLNMSIWVIPTSLPMYAKFLWLTFSLLAFETADTFFATPYNAIGIELSKTHNESAQIQSCKSFFFIIGMIMPSVLMMIFMTPGEIELSQTSQTPYIKIGLIASSICLLCGVITFLFAKSSTKNGVGTLSLTPQKQSSLQSMFITFFSMFKKPQFTYVIVGYCASMVATCFLTSIGMHAFTYSFHYNSWQISLLLLTLCFGAMTSQFFCAKSSNKIGKQKTLVKYMFFIIYSVLAILVVFLLKNFLDKNLVYCLMILLIFVCGFGSGALYSLPLAIFSDIVQDYNASSGTNQTATLSGVMTFTFKVANAVALLLIGILLDIIKFNPAKPVQAIAVQYKLGMILILGVLASISVAISMFSKKS